MEQTVTLEGFKLIGLKLPGKTTNEKGQSGIDCGNLWQKFEKGDLANKIPGKLEDAIYAVYYSYEGDHTQPFSYFIGCKVADDTPDQPGMDSLVIPEQSYVQKMARGKMPDCVADTWREIWTSDIKRAYGYDFEVYDKRSHDWNNATVDIYLSV